MTKQRSIQEYYDTVAQAYDHKHGVVDVGQAYNFDRHYAPFLARTVPQQGRVLEIGCGTGVYTRWLRDRGLAVHAMDISPAMIVEARKRCPDAAYVAGDCEDPASVLDAAAIGEGFDAIVGINTFSYYPRKAEALANYAALLRPGGRLIIIDMNGASPAYAIMAAMDKNEIGAWLGEVRGCTKGALLPMLADAGLRVEVMTRFAFIPNGVGKGVVNLLRPFDGLLGALPLTNWLAMRIAFSAIKEAAPR